MRCSWRWVVVALCGVITLASVSLGDTPKKKQYQIDAVWKRGDPLGSPADGRVDILMSSRMVVEDKMSDTVFGGQVVMFGTKPTHVGRKLEITPESGEAGTIRLQALLENSQLQPAIINGANTFGLKTREVTFKKTVKPGKTLYLRLRNWSEAEDFEWVELTVKEHEEKK